MDAITEYRRPNDTRVSNTPKREPEARGRQFNMISAATLLNTDEDVLRQRDIMADPVVWSLKRTLKKVGQMIYIRVGSTDELVKIAEQVANCDPYRYARRMSPIDSAWNGVGSGNDRWWS